MLKESAFSKRLKELRKKAGLKQFELADLSGIDPNLVSRYERGESMPTLETAQKLALSLGVNIDHLLNEPAKQEFEVKMLKSSLILRHKPCVPSQILCLFSLSDKSLICAKLLLYF